MNALQTMIVVLEKQHQNLLKLVAALSEKLTYPNFPEAAKCVERDRVSQLETDVRPLAEEQNGKLKELGNDVNEELQLVAEMFAKMEECPNEQQHNIDASTEEHKGIGHEELKEESKDMKQLKEELKDMKQLKEELKDMKQLKEELKDMKPLKEELKDMKQLKEASKDMKQERTCGIMDCGPGPKRVVDLPLRGFVVPTKDARLPSGKFKKSIKTCLLHY
uniref:Glutamine-rich protein 2-like n=1 Tax=Globodera pallida TaxID=36090 RepID=A0A183BU65_GLOPA